MANKALPDHIKSVGEAMHVALVATFSTLTVKDAAGHTDATGTKRAFGYALRKFLRASGEMKSGGRTGADVDWGNLDKALYAAFVSIAKTEAGKPVAQLSALLYKGVAALAVPLEEIDRAKKVLRAALDRADTRFLLVTTAGRFGGTTVTLKDPANPGPIADFKAWAVMHAAAPAAPVAPAAHPAPAAPAHPVTVAAPAAAAKTASAPKAKGK